MGGSWWLHCDPCSPRWSPSGPKEGISATRANPPPPIEFYFWGLTKVHRLFGMESCMSLDGFHLIFDRFYLVKPPKTSSETNNRVLSPPRVWRRQHLNYNMRVSDELCHTTRRWGEREKQIFNICAAFNFDLNPCRKKSSTSIFLDFLSQENAQSTRKTMFLRRSHMTVFKRR